MNTVLFRHINRSITQYILRIINVKFRERTTEVEIRIATEEESSKESFKNIRKVMVGCEKNKDIFRKIHKGFAFYIPFFFVCEKIKFREIFLNYREIRESLFSV